MGDLPTPKDLNEGRFARQEDYSKAKNIMNEALIRLYDQGKLYGASIYGSTINGETRLGSDIDVFVIAHSITAAVPELRFLRSEVEKRYVPVEINPLISTHQAIGGKHSIQADFREYLNLAITDQTSIGNNPLNILKERPLEIPSHLELILREESELRRLTRDCTAPQYSKSHCKFLSRMLNYTLFTPKNLYYVKHGRLPANRILSKPELVEIYKKEFPEVNPKYLDKAILFWKEIKNIFKQETINVKEYEALLGWFSNLYDEYEAFVLQNIDLIKDMWIKQKNKK